MMVPSVADAGAAIVYRVSVSTPASGVKSAYGSVWGARTSTDTVSYIGCALYGSWTHSYVYCAARNSSGTTAACIAYEDEPNFEGMARAATMVNWNSVISFETATDGATCGHIQVENTSRFSQLQ